MPKLAQRPRPVIAKSVPCQIFGLSVGFERLYGTYQEFVAGFSSVARDAMFRGHGSRLVQEKDDSP